MPYTELPMKHQTIQPFLLLIHVVVWRFFECAVGTGRCLWAPSHGLYSMGQNMAYNVLRLCVRLRSVGLCVRLLAQNRCYRLPFFQN